MSPSRLVLRLVLALAGAAIVFLGLNVGLGGIQTLGWQGNGGFLTVTDPGLYAVRDNHVRFIGGVWLGVGLAFLAGAVWLAQLRTTLLVLIGMIAIGGVVRLAAGDLALLAGPEIGPSLILELAGFPLLAAWLVRDGRRAAA